MPDATRPLAVPHDWSDAFAALPLEAPRRGWLERVSRARLDARRRATLAGCGSAHCGRAGARGGAAAGSWGSATPRVGDRPTLGHDNVGRRRRDRDRLRCSCRPSRRSWKRCSPLARDERVSSGQPRGAGRRTRRRSVAGIDAALTQPAWPHRAQPRCGSTASTRCARSPASKARAAGSPPGRALRRRAGQRRLNLEHNVHCRTRHESRDSQLRMLHRADRRRACAAALACRDRRRRGTRRPRLPPHGGEQRARTRRRARRPRACRRARGRIRAGRIRGSASASSIASSASR